MWSCHWFAGCHFGFEFYSADKVDTTEELYAHTSKYEYFIIDLGCLRIQKCTKTEDV